MRINFTAGAVFGRKLYGGGSQHKVVDLGKPATRLGKACREQRAHLGSRALRLGIAVATSKLGYKAQSTTSSPKAAKAVTRVWSEWISVVWREQTDATRRYYQQRKLYN
jgi:hypothetical protein